MNPSHSDGAQPAARAELTTQAVQAPADAAPAVRGEVAPHAWYMLAILTAIFVLSFIDRSSLSLVVGPIKREFGVGDFQMSLLLGVSFVLFYSTISIPAGYLVDRFSRRGVIGWAVFAWSAMTVLCGVAKNYVQLFLCRAGIGIGEAALQPAAYSMIRDAFPPDRRGRAFGIYQMGPMVGVGFSLFIGGWLLQLSESGAVAGLPWLGTLKPWQFVIVVPGLIGLPFAALMLSLREPARVAAQKSAPTGGWSAYREALGFVGKEWRLYAPLWGAATLYAMAISGFNAWAPTVVAQTWQMPLSSVGRSLGPLMMASVPLGLFVFGAVMDRMSKRGRNAAPLEVAMVTVIVANVATLALAFIGDQLTAAALYACHAFFASPVPSSAGATMAQITPSRLMGRLTSVFFLVQNLLGLAIGPTMATLLAHLYGDDPHALRYGIVTLYCLCTGLAAVLYAFVARRVRDRKFE
ncbi:MAG: MFS transporter [Rudaea sp.]|uniref:MFS transporter n=1 Tax=unclassified Rudaea TaxID=2627037 RepID=UPI0010F4CD8E|nr:MULTISPECIES: MFS transporter [unclassified Rudaea]MBN8885712.1 MFS transporter [Rudaea sp.]MBR0345381.1 MFS transporter [Rudaea sp.]